MRKFFAIFLSLSIMLTIVSNFNAFAEPIAAVTASDPQSWDTDTNVRLLFIQ